MSVPFGGLQVLSNSTGVTATATPTKYATGWSLLGPTNHGGLDAVPSVANSNIVLTEGNWEVVFNASVLKSGMSAGGGASEEVTFQAYLDGVALVGALCQIDPLDSGTLVVGFAVPINVAHGAAGALDLRISSSETSNSDVEVLNANFYVKRLD